MPFAFHPSSYASLLDTVSSRRHNRVHMPDTATTRRAPDTSPPQQQVPTRTRFFVGAIISILFYPLSRQRMREIRAQLDARKQPPAEAAP
jgi:hypothetical protein